jgi:hypothetical protein
MRRQSLLLVAAVIVAGSVASQNRGHRVMAQEPVRAAAADVELFVKQALEDRFAAKDLPGYNLLRNATRIAIREEIPKPGLRLGNRALPQREGYEFHLAAEAAVQAEANRTGQAVPFIGVDQPLISGDAATLSLGVDLAVPPRPNSVKLCCCVGEGRFRQLDGRWTFVEWSSMACA